VPTAGNAMDQAIAEKVHLMEEPMCPSYQATRNGPNTTRARANMPA